jgi:hypothetical protein
MLLLPGCINEGCRKANVLRLSQSMRWVPAGKSVVFLRECCGDAEFEAAAAPEALRSGSNAALLEVRI